MSLKTEHLKFKTVSKIYYRRDNALTALLFLKVKTGEQILTLQL